MVLHGIYWPRLEPPGHFFRRLRYSPALIFISPKHLARFWIDQMDPRANCAIFASLAFALFDRPLGRSASNEQLMRAYLARIADLQKKARD
jgi:hypothetical protein